MCWKPGRGNVVEGVIRRLVDIREQACPNRHATKLNIASPFATAGKGGEKLVESDGS